MRRRLHNGFPLLLLFTLGQWPRIAAAGALEPGCVAVKLTDSKPGAQGAPAYRCYPDKPVRQGRNLCLNSVPNGERRSSERDSIHENRVA
jgi:hypothetical protein